jgi:hypothetical protein
MSIEKAESPTRSSQEKDKEVFSEHDDVHKVPLYNPHVDVSGVDERKLLRKIDWMLIPWLSLLYLSSFLDRTAIGK